MEDWILHYSGCRSCKHLSLPRTVCQLQQKAAQAWHLLAAGCGDRRLAPAWLCLGCAVVWHLCASSPLGKAPCTLRVTKAHPASVWLHLTSSNGATLDLCGRRCRLHHFRHVLALCVPLSSTVCVWTCCWVRTAPLHTPCDNLRSVFTHLTAACCVRRWFREGMSGVVASLLGIVQSPGVDNRFSVTAFFVCVALLMTCSAAAFAGISRRGAWKKELRDVHTVDGNSSTSSHSNHRAVGNGAGSAGSPTVDRRRSGPRGSTGSNNSSDGGSAPRDAVNESSPIVTGTPRSTHPEAVPELHLPAAAPQDATSQSEISLVSSEAWGVLKVCAGPLLALWWLSFMSNGVLLSFRTYITLPYKNGDNVRSRHTHYHPQLQAHMHGLPKLSHRCSSGRECWSRLQTHLRPC